MAKKRSTKKRGRNLEKRLLTLEREQRDLAKRLKKLTRQLESRPDPKKTFGKGSWQADGGPSPGRFAGPRGGLRGGPPWRKQFGPVVSLEVPLETNDPSAPLWATVAARLPEEIATVGDDGTVSTYRYSAAGSTPQAPRYRQLQDASEPFPA